MGLVVILATGAVVVLKAWQALQAAGETGVALLVTLRQQAAVVATLALAVFVLLDALEKGRVAASMLTAASGGAVAAAAAATGDAGVRFTRPASLSAAAVGGTQSS